MKCYYDIIIGDNKPVSIPIETEDGNLVLNNELLTALKNSPELAKQISNLVFEELSKSTSARPVTFKQLLKKGALLANTNVEFLRSQYPDIFPETAQADVLLIDNLKIGGLLISGRIINSQGKEVFVIKNNPNDLRRFANYLKLKEQLELGAADFNDNTGIIAKMLEATGQKNITSLLLDYSQNDSKYLDKFVDNQSYYKVLYDISRQLLNKPQVRNFNNPILNNIYAYLLSHDDWKYKNDTFIKTGLSKLDVNFLYNILSQYNPDLLKSNNIPDLKTFKSQLRNKNFAEGLFNAFTQLSPQFSYKFEKLQGDIIYAKTEPLTVEEQYGWTYDTLQSFDLQESYKGYQIYAYNENGITSYYATRGSVTKRSFLSPSQETIDDIREWVDNKVNNTKLANHSLLQFKFGIDDNTVTTYDGLVVGSVIASLDVPLTKPRALTQFPINEQELLRDKSTKSVKDFSEVVDSWDIDTTLKEEIKSEVNTAEKITIMLYKAQDLLGNQRNDSHIIRQILNQIKEADIKYYYVDEALPSHKYRLIPTDLHTLENYHKEGENLPTIKFLTALSTILQQQIPGIKVNVETSSTIKELFGDIDTNTTRAFIRDGEIYLNSTLCKATDLLHEYTHLILGMLRANETTRSNYESLLLRIISSNDPSVKAELKNVQEAYPNISQMDMYEEVFANLFSKHLIDHDIPIFTTNEGEMRQLTETVFGQNIATPEDMQKFYTGSIESVFKRFNKDIAALLATKNLSWEDSRNYRQLSNYISDQIKQGNITEKCI